MEIGSALLPLITPLLTELAARREGGGRLDQVEQWAAAASAIVIAAGLALVVVGTTVSGFSATLGLAATVITTVGTAMRKCRNDFDGIREDFFIRHEHPLAVVSLENLEKYPCGRSIRALNAVGRLWKWHRLPLLPVGRQEFPAVS